MTQKILAGLCVLGLGLAAFNAQAYQGLHCGNSHQESVYFLEKVDSGYQLTVNHLGGEGSIPVDTNRELLSLGALEWVKTKAEIFNAMGLTYQIHFSNSQCGFAQDSKVGLCKAENIEVNGVAVKEFRFSYMIQGEPLEHDRWSDTDISLEYIIRDTSPYFDGEEGSPYHFHLLALDFNYSSECTFRGF